MLQPSNIGAPVRRNYNTQSANKHRLVTLASEPGNVNDVHLDSRQQGDHCQHRSKVRRLPPRRLQGGFTLETVQSESNLHEDVSCEASCSVHETFNYTSIDLTQKHENYNYKPSNLTQTNVEKHCFCPDLGQTSESFTYESQNSSSPNESYCYAPEWIRATESYTYKSDFAKELVRRKQVMNKSFLPKNHRHQPSVKLSFDSGDSIDDIDHCNVLKDKPDLVDGRSCHVEEFEATREPSAEAESGDVTANWRQEPGKTREALSTHGSDDLATGQPLSIEEPDCLATSEALPTEDPDGLASREALSTEEPDDFASSGALTTEGPGGLASSEALPTEEPDGLESREALSTKEPDGSACKESLSRHISDGLAIREALSINISIGLQECDDLAKSTDYSGNSNFTDVWNKSSNKVEQETELGDAVGEKDESDGETDPVGDEDRGVTETKAGLSHEKRCSVTNEDFDLCNFDFEQLTKPREELNSNQKDYKRLCVWFRLIPNALIVRSLNTTRVILRGQQLGPRGIKALCGALTTNCIVIDLEISEDVIDVNTMSNIIEMKKDNAFIIHMDLSNNHMGRLPVKLLLEALSERDNIAALNLSGNDLCDNDADIFEEFIKSTNYLQHLDLSYNGFRQEAGRILGQVFGMNTYLETLSMRWNNLNFRGAMSFIYGVGNSSSITFLDLAWNGIGEEGCKNLCRMLQKNTVLEELDVSSNRINFRGLTEILSATKQNKSLRNLHIGDNIMSSSDAHELLKNLLAVKGEIGLKNLSLGRQTIRMNTVNLVNSLLDDRDVMVTHGEVYGIKQKTDAEELASLNPVTLLLEFGRLLEMTIEELFDYIDADGGGTLSREEIRDGLFEFDIPLPERSLDILIRKMDSDGDGEIAMSDLQSATIPEDSNFIKAKMKSHCQSVSNVETERIRCRKILKRLMADKDVDMTRRETTSNQSSEVPASKASIADEENVVLAEPQNTDVM